MKNKIGICLVVVIIMFPVSGYAANYSIQNVNGTINYGSYATGATPTDSSRCLSTSIGMVGCYNDYDSPGCGNHTHIMEGADAGGAVAIGTMVVRSDGARAYVCEPKGYGLGFYEKTTYECYRRDVQNPVSGVYRKGVCADGELYDHMAIVQAEASNYYCAPGYYVSISGTCSVCPSDSICTGYVNRASAAGTGRTICASGTTPNSGKTACIQIKGQFAFLQYSSDLCDIIGSFSLSMKNGECVGFVIKSGECGGYSSGDTYVLIPSYYGETGGSSAIDTYYNTNGMYMGCRCNSGYEPDGWSFIGANDYYYIEQSKPVNLSHFFPEYSKGCRETACEAGYYKQDGGCYQCPKSELYTNSALTVKAYGTSVKGANYDINSCFLPAGTYYDVTGTVSLTGQCSY